MRKRTDPDQGADFSRELLIGLGESSVRKSYYPELQRRMVELERFQLLLDQALDAIFLLDSKAGDILYVNAAVSEYCGCHEAEIKGEHISRWLSLPGNPELSDTDEARFAPFRSVDCMLNQQAGGSIPVEVSINRVQLQDGAYLVIMARDITERKRAEEHHMAVHEELHANYEELEALYGQLSFTEESLREKVDELEASQTALEASETRYRLALEGANDAIWDWDLRDGKSSVSHNWREKIRVLDDDSLDYIALFESSIHPDDAHARQVALDRHFAGETAHFQAEYRIQLPTGEWIWLLSRGKALFDAVGNPVRMSGSFTDITERKRQEEHIAYIAFHDSLTGMKNRFSFHQALSGLLGTVLASQPSGGVFLLDLDNFKLVNDSWGHTFGDTLLKEIAERLCRFGDSDVSAYRLGGDEFVLVLNTLTKDTVAVWAERVLNLFDKPAIIHNTQLPLSSSIGAALFYKNITPDDVLRHADIALHQAKAAGKRTWRLYRTEMQNAILERIRLESELRQALTGEQFVLHYQPQYDLVGFPVAMEALLRWDHPTCGLVPPLSFISVAEDTGMIVPLGEWVIRNACRFGRQNMEGNGQLRIAVNVSARQMMQDDFAKRLISIVRAEKYPPEMLELEITESVLMESFDSNVRKLNELRSNGLRIALDDFGTGYSSLTYLSRLPIDVLKIDKSFLLGTDEYVNSAIVGIIVQLAHELKLSVVAEGVETAEQLDTLRRLGCDYMQGFLTNPPLPTELARQIRREKHSVFK